jgi:superfamily II DNA or RNA helicase
VFSSWNDSKRVLEYQDLFDESWKNDTPHLIHIPFDRVKTYIKQKFPSEPINELLQYSIELRNFDIEDNKVNKPFSPHLLEKIQKKEQEPRFPFPEERDIQKNAYAAWIENDKKGIFAMATGSGKTITALNCVLKRYSLEGYYKVVIVVPTRTLVLQWEQEAKAFNFQNIVSTLSDKDWKNILNRYTTRSIFDQKKNIVLITTYATFNRKDIQTFFKRHFRN